MQAETAAAVEAIQYATEGYVSAWFFGYFILTLAIVTGGFYLQGVLMGQQREDLNRRIDDQNGWRKSELDRLLEEVERLREEFRESRRGSP